MRAILINPADRTVTEIQVGKTYAELKHAIGDRWLEVASPASIEPHFLYCDEEGRLRPNHLFQIAGWPHPIAGKALVLGGIDKAGDEVPASLSVDQIMAQITWL